MRATAPELIDPANYEYGIDIPTRFADMDINAHVNNAALLSIFEDARVRFSAQIGANPLLSERRILIVATHLEYLAQTHYPTPVHVKIGVLALGRSSWSLAHLGLQDGAATGFLRATLVSSEGARALPMLDAHRQCLQRHMLRHLRGK